MALCTIEEPQVLHLADAHEQVFLCFVWVPRLEPGIPVQSFVGLSVLRESLCPWGHHGYPLLPRFGPHTLPHHSLQYHCRSLHPLRRFRCLRPFPVNIFSSSRRFLLVSRPVTRTLSTGGSSLPVYG